VARDPVCGREVAPSDCPLRAIYAGQAFYFCSPACKDAFDRHAHRYACGDEAYGPSSLGGCPEGGWPVSRR